MPFQKGVIQNPQGRIGRPRKPLTEKLNSHIDKVSEVLAKATTEERNEFLLKITTLVLMAPKRTRLRTKSNSNGLDALSHQNNLSYS